MRTVILCGGKGARLGDLGRELPKPLLPVGDHPLVWHLMKIYATQGHCDFVLCLGHLKERFYEYFGDPPASARGWSVELSDTGPETPTGGRLLRIAPLVDGPLFFATYGDGLSDVDLARLLAFHRSHGRVATMTAVRPRVNFGVAHIADDGKVTRFDEKPLMDARVNGGFFVFDRRVFDYLADDSVLEREPLERLAAEGELMAYRHDGFWTCMDTYKDHLLLNEWWERGDAPWRIWAEA